MSRKCIYEGTLEKKGFCFFYVHMLSILIFSRTSEVTVNLNYLQQKPTKLFYNVAKGLLFFFVRKELNFTKGS